MEGEKNQIKQLAIASGKGGTGRTTVASVMKFRISFSGCGRK
jgi:MinD superfamily P-loop ATPase